MLPFLSGIAGIVAGLVRAGSMYAPFTPERDTRSRGFRPADAPNVGVLLMILWIIALPAAYVLFDFQILSRYLVPVLPPVIVLGVLSFDYLTAQAARARNALLVAFTVIAVIQSVVIYALVIVPPTRAFSRGINEVLVPMGEWLAEHTEPGAVVACPDIGAIGFVSNRTVLDLGGLVTPEINRMRRTIDVERIIGEGLYLRFAPDYLVDRHTTPSRFSQQTIGGINFEPVMTGIVANLGIRKPGPVVYVLYRLAPVDTGVHVEN
jgi:hypothetical protein